MVTVTGNAMLCVLVGIAAYVLLVLASGRYLRRVAKAEYQRGWNDAMDVAAEASAAISRWPSPEEVIARTWPKPPTLYDQDACSRDPWEGAP